MDPAEKAHYKPPLLDLQCLQIQKFLFLVLKIFNTVYLKFILILKVGSCPNSENSHQILLCPFLCSI